MTLGNRVYSFSVKSNSSECERWLCGVAPTASGNVRLLTDAQQANDRVAEGGHHLWDLPSAHLRAVFIEGDVAHVVQFVWTCPGLVDT